MGFLIIQVWFSLVGLVWAFEKVYFKTARTKFNFNGITPDSTTPVLTKTYEFKNN